MLIKNFKYIISIIVSVFLLIKISKNIYINVEDLSFIRDKFLTLIIFFLLFLPTFYFLSIKLKILVSYKKKINLIDAFKASIISYNYNLFLPAKSGDLLRHKYLNLNISFKEFFNLNILEKMITFGTIYIFIIISFLKTKSNFQIFNNLDNNIIINIILFSLITISFIFIKFYNSHKFLKVKISNLLFFDIMIWLIQFLQIFLIIKIIGVNLDIFKTVFIFGTSILLGLLPISLGGFGVRDYVIYYFLNSLGLSDHIFLILIFFNLRYLFPLLIGVIISLLNIRQ